VNMTMGRQKAVDLETLHRIARSPRAGELLRKWLAMNDGPSPYQRSLPIIEPRPTLGARLLEYDRVPCRMGGMLLVRTCLLIRSRVWPSGRRKGHPRQLACVGCPLGEEYARRLPGYPLPAQSQPAEVLSPQQRLAKSAQTNGRSYALDPVCEAASMTPEDVGLEHAE
jgi:hypothetical protein